MEDLTEGMNLSQKEQEVREFLRKETSIEEDKLRLIVIYLVYSKGMKKEKVRNLLSIAGINATEGMKIISSLADRFNLNLISKQGSFLPNPMDKIKAIRSNGTSRKSISESVTPKDSHRRLSSSEPSILRTLKNAANALKGAADSVLDPHQLLLSMRQESVQEQEESASQFERWRPLVCQLASDGGEQELLRSGLFSPVLEEATLRSLASPGGHRSACQPQLPRTVSKIIIFIGGGLCQAEISAIRTINNTSGCKVYIGSDRFTNAASLLNIPTRY